MAGRIVYIIAAGLMGLSAAVPMAEAFGPVTLGCIACAWVAGAFFAPAYITELIADHYRTVLAIYGFCMIFALFAPALGLFVLMALMLLVRNPEFFGVLVLTSLLVLAFGLAEAPSYEAPAAMLACLLAAAHARAARTPSMYSAGIVLLVLWAAFCAGGMLALSAPLGLPALVAGRSGDSAPPAERSPTLLVIMLIVLPVAGFILVKQLHFLTRARRGRGARAAAVEGRLDKDEAMLEEADARFGGRGANAAVVKDYIKWRAQLAACGCKFVRADTAEEGAAGLAFLLSPLEDARVERITALFNLARYGGEELPAADVEEFAALTRAVARDCLQRRHARMR